MLRTYWIRSDGNSLEKYCKPQFAAVSHFLGSRHFLRQLLRQKMSTVLQLTVVGSHWFSIRYVKITFYRSDIDFGMAYIVLELFVLFTIIATTVHAQTHSTEIHERITVEIASETSAIHNMDYVLQDRIIERLHSLIQYVDKLTSNIQSNKTNTPIIQLLKGTHFTLRAKQFEQV